MGCDCSQPRALALDEEYIIRDYEATLGYQSLSTAQLCAAITALSTSECLTRMQLETLMRNTGLRSCNLGVPEQPLTKLYTWLRGDQGWEVRKLVALSLILSPDSIPDKVTVMMEVYQPHTFDVLLLDSFDQFLRDVCLISLKLLPEMTIGLLQKENQVSIASQVLIYQKKLEFSLNSCAEHLKYQLFPPFQTSVSLNSLHKKPQLLKQLFSSKEIRYLAINLWKIGKVGVKLQKQMNVDGMVPAVR